MLRRIALLAALVAFGLVALQWGRRHPEMLPWTPLDLARPIGPFTAAKLAALGDDAPRCRALLTAAGADFTPLPPLRRGLCGYGDGIDLKLRPRWQPAPLRTACPVAAALLLWERQVVRPAALKHFGQPVTAIEHFGSYNCRSIAGSRTASEHSTADAIDIAGVRLRDGTRITIKADWYGDPNRAAFLHTLRDGACELFATTLSPDYNAAHADHFHFDQAERGRYGGQICR